MFSNATSVKITDKLKERSLRKNIQRQYLLNCFSVFVAHSEQASKNSDLKLQFMPDKLHIQIKQYSEIKTFSKLADQNNNRAMPDKKVMKSALTI